MVLLAASVVVVVLAVAAVLAFRSDGGVPVTRIDPNAHPSGDAPPSPVGDLTGQAIAPLAYERFDGTRGSVGGPAERPAVVNFFAYWCVPCRTEMPDFQQVHEELGPDVTFVGLDYIDRPEQGAKLVAETGVTYDVGQDPDGDLLDAVGGVSMPTTVFLRADGTVAYVHSGKLDAGQLRQLIGEHFGIRAPA